MVAYRSRAIYIGTKNAATTRVLWFLHLSYIVSFISCVPFSLISYLINFSVSVTDVVFVILLFVGLSIIRIQRLTTI